MIYDDIHQKMDKILHKASHTQDHSQQFFIDFRKELNSTFSKEELVELYKRALSLPYNPQVPAIMHGISITYNQNVPLDQKEDLFKKVESLIADNKEMDMTSNTKMVSSIYLNTSHPMVSKWMPSFMRAHIKSQHGNFLSERIHSNDPDTQKFIVGSLVNARMAIEPTSGKESDAHFKNSQHSLFDSFISYAKEIYKEHQEKLSIKQNDNAKNATPDIKDKTDDKISISSKKDNMFSEKSFVSKLSAALSNLTKEKVKITHSMRHKPK